MRCQGCSSPRYWLTSAASRSTSVMPALNRAAPSRSPTDSNPRSTSATSSRSRSVSSPGSGTAPKLRWALTSVRCTRLPQAPTSSSLFRRTYSAPVPGPLDGGRQVADDGIEPDVDALVGPLFPAGQRDGHAPVQVARDRAGLQVVDVAE